MDATSIMVQGILAAVAGYERHIITQRMAGGRKAKAARGGYAHGQPRYGTRTIGGTLVSDDAEVAALARMTALREQGASFRAIAAALNDEGYKPRRAGSWNNVTVRSALLAAERAEARCS